MVLIPKKLSKGDVIGIVSPSRPVFRELAGQFERGIAFLEAHGFNVVIGEHVYSATLGYAASPREKAEDINRMFADESVQAILCSQGGATANACLPYLDWDNIRSHPKIFLGMSDITVLLNAIHHKTGLVTFHGSDLMWGFGRNPSAYDEQEFIASLMDARTGAIPPNRARQTVRNGIAEGKLLGGNLPCLAKLAGTPYFPDFTGAIFFVEAMGIQPEECDHFFQQLKQIGVFDRIRGALVGYIDSLQKDENAVMQMEDVLLHVTAEFDFPILKVNDFGHNCPNTILPVGGNVRMDADKGTLEILEECVQ
ncbi:MAG TPA: LD-carboxypeptidase [Anaerolineales bacterium]|nr:LD-carboxypeptidase [Anaerolineales bacterium]